MTQAQQPMEDSRSAIQRELELLRSELAAPQGKHKIVTAHIYRILALTNWLKRMATTVTARV